MKEEKGFKEQLLDMYENGELTVLSRRDSFNFDCVRCGQCCRDRDDILLNPLDFHRLCRGLGMQPTEVLIKYCDLYPGYSSRLPILRIQFRPTYGLGGEITGMRCPFLGQKDGLYHCRIQAYKPFVCFSYPLGRIQKAEDEAQYILQPDPGCKGARKAQAEGTMQNVEAWMFGKEHLDMEDRFNKLYAGFLMRYHDWINVDKLAGIKKDSGALYKKWLAKMSRYLYGEYDHSLGDEAFLIQLQDNIKEMEAYCRDLAEKHPNLKPKPRK